MRYLLLSTIILLTSCTAHTPIVSTDTQVYQGEYVLEMEADGNWCPFDPYLPVGERECVTELGPGIFTLKESGWVRLIKSGVGILSANTVPYSKETDLCLSEFLDKECSPNYVMSTYEEVIPWGVSHVRNNANWDDYGGDGVRVAVVDTGVDCTHEDIRCVAQFDAITDNDKQVDDNGHGTHVAGTVSATMGNNRGVVGVAPNSEIIAAKFLSSSGSGSLFNAVRAVDFSVRAGAKVINASWGCRECYNQALYNAIKRARDSNVLFVAAAGNSGVNTDDVQHYPSNYDLDNIISVAACDTTDRLASFSNYGEKTVDVCAPGVNIRSTVPSGYGSLSGTSMAAPHIAGAAALLYTEDTARWKDKILRNVRKTRDLKGKTTAGGVIQLKPKTKTCQKQKYKRWLRYICYPKYRRGKIKRWQKCQKKGKKKFHC